MLSGEGLKGALEGGLIFAKGSWATTQIVGAGYELRLSGDLLVIPAAPGAPGFKTIRQGDPPLGEFILEPGDSALISTRERFCMDFGITGTLGPKFRWSAKGLLVLQGMVAHPGYGMEQSAAGEWQPKDNERLYLVVANVGPAEITLRRDDPIAYIQFFRVEPDARPAPVANFGFDDLRTRFFSQGDLGAGGGLQYFRGFRDLRDQMTGISSGVDEQLRVGRAALSEEVRAALERQRQEVSDVQLALEGNTQVLRGRVDEAHVDVARVSGATDRVLVFGVFVIVATLLGVVLSTLTGIVERLPERLVWNWKTVAVMVSLGVYSGAVVVAAIRVFTSTKSTPRA